MGIFDRMFRKKKKPSVKQKARTRRAFGKGKKSEERVSDIPETVVKGKRRPNESQELKAKKAGVTTAKASPKAPAMAKPNKTKAPTADMMRRKAATDPGMPAEGMAKSVGEAKKSGKSKFIGKDGRQKAAVTKEELEASGLSLRDYLNKQQGKTRKPAMKEGGKVPKYKAGGKVRGAGKATKGVRACKMR
tara:strand:- start:382 stop:951 length:570 start_codon:yes stop_codon:yes gene_type:complete